MSKISMSWTGPAVVATIALSVIIGALILWVIITPRPDRSGTVLAKRAYPESTELVPMYDPTLHTMIAHPVVSGPDWALVVRRPGGQTITVWVRRTVYEACHVGDWYVSSRQFCRP